MWVAQLLAACAAHTVSLAACQHSVELLYVRLT
jgi:hypothetical protein